MSDSGSQASLAARLTAVEDAVESLEAQVDALTTVGADMDSKEEKYAAVLKLALEKCGDSETVSVGPHEIRNCTGVSRRYAYDLIDAMGTSLPVCEVRESDVVETITGTRRRSKALIVDCAAVRNGEPPVPLRNLSESNEEHATSAETSSNEGEDLSAGDLDVLTGLTPRSFEEYVADVWRASGYTCRLTERSRDSGVDVVADRGDERLLIQVKRYTNRDVGIETVQRLAGLLVDDEFDASRVLLVTTSGFTAAAKRRAGRISNLELVDGAGLVSRGSDAGLSLHSEDHGYETELTDEEILSVFDNGEPMTTIEVADALGAESRSVLVHLESLVDDDVIRVKRIGDEVGVWYR
jgi:hypothetical protein